MLNQIIGQELIREDQANPLLVGKISIVIPAYNEAKRIGATISSLLEHIPEIKEIIVVFDGTDGTADVVSKLGGKVKILRFNNRLGQGRAIFTGFRISTGDVICFVDADGASPWYEIKRICSQVNEVTPAVFGSRWVKESKIGKKEPLVNIIGGRMYYLFSFLILGVDVKDSFCGLKAFTKSIAKDLAKKIVIDDRTFNVAISYHLKQMGVRPKEIGIEWHHQYGSKLPVDLKVIVVMFTTLIGLRLAHSHFKSLRKLSISFRNKISFY